MILLRWGPRSNCSISLILPASAQLSPKYPQLPLVLGQGTLLVLAGVPTLRFCLRKKQYLLQMEGEIPPNPPNLQKEHTQQGWKHKNQVFVLTVHRHCDYINNEQQEHKWTLWEKNPLTFFHCSKAQTTKNSLTQIPSISSHTRAVIVGFNTQVQQEQ